ncbi:hypothetical protein D3C87_1531660 [compost metagenome]
MRALIRITDSKCLLLSWLLGLLGSRRRLRWRLIAVDRIDLIANDLGGSVLG